MVRWITASRNHYWPVILVTVLWSVETSMLFSEKKTNKLRCNACLFAQELSIYYRKLEVILHSYSMKLHNFELFFRLQRGNREIWVISWISLTPNYFQCILSWKELKQVSKERISSIPQIALVNTLTHLLAFSWSAGECFYLPLLPPW